MATLKFILYTTDDRQIVLRFKEDIDTIYKGTVGIGGYYRDHLMMRTVGEGPFRRDRVGMPKMIQCNKCLFEFRATLTEFKDAIEELQKMDGIHVEQVTSFGTLIR